MAIITISRKIASLGDETSSKLAEKLDYNFIERKELEQHLINKGIEKEKLKKYDEKRPGFWASLSRDRDEYFDLLREVVYEIADMGNCIFIGRGGFAILNNIPGVYTVRLVSNDDVRIKRIMEEFGYSEKKAKELIQESDDNRNGFHRCFFNVKQEDSTFYNMVLNTSNITASDAAEIIKKALDTTIKEENIKEGEIRIKELLQAQKIVNYISFNLKLPIYFLDAEISKENVVLHGVADSSNVVDKAMSIAEEICKNKKVSSKIKLMNAYTGKQY